jgi:hypothetical protein
MNPLIKKEKDFLRLFLHTSDKQKKVLIKNIEKSQLNAIVQIVYNVMLGIRPLAEKDKNRIANRKTIIRQFVSKGISLKRRKKLLFKHFKYILPFIAAVKNELL